MSDRIFLVVSLRLSPDSGPAAAQPSRQNEQVGQMQTERQRAGTGMKYERHEITI